MHAQHCSIDGDFHMPSSPGHCRQQPCHLPLCGSASWVCANRLLFLWSVFTVALLKAVRARQPCGEREDEPARSVGTGVRQWASSAEVMRALEGSWAAETQVWAYHPLVVAHPDLRSGVWRT